MERLDGIKFIIYSEFSDTYTSYQFNNNNNNKLILAKFNEHG